MIKNPAEFTGMMPQPVVHFKWLTRVKRADIDLQASFEIVWVHVLRPAVPAFVLQRTADKIKPALIEVVAELVRSGHPDHDWHGLGNHLEPLLALPKISLELLNHIHRRCGSVRLLAGSLANRVFFPLFAYAGRTHASSQFLFRVYDPSLQCADIIRCCEPAALLLCCNLVVNRRL